MSAHTSVAKDHSTLHTVNLSLACCRIISLGALEWAVLFLYRLGEFAARVVATSYLWYALEELGSCIASSHATASWLTSQDLLIKLSPPLP